MESQKEMKSAKQNIGCILLVIIFIILVIGGCDLLNEEFGLKDESFIEEMLEDMVRHETKVDLDLTPRTLELMN